MNAPYLITDNKEINKAYRLAVANLAANIQPFQDGILSKPEPVIIAGLGYTTPWTRDAAINTWNAGGLICPDTSLNTLKSVLIPYKNGYRIGGEYWDAIIWVIGAWYQYLYTGDKDFLEIAYNATVNSLEYFESTEFSDEFNLFRGPACYGDGISAYPDVYAEDVGSGIATFAVVHKDLCEEKGVGIPIYALSTNCLYYYAYVLADKMSVALGKKPAFSEKSDKMKKAINKYFWSESKQNYTYIFDKFGGCDYQEGIGISFAILFDVADDDKKEKIFKNTHITSHGITCVWPAFERYLSYGKKAYGRHSGTVWPHIQGFWADAAAKNSKIEIFDSEFYNQTINAVNYHQFAEIYHPDTGEIYGGIQEYGGAQKESQRGIVEWRSEPYQTWRATAYLRNVYMNLLGMTFSEKGISFKPVGSKLVTDISLKNFIYRNSTLNISVKGNGNSVLSFKLNGKETDNFIPCDIADMNEIEILLS